MRPGRGDKRKKYRAIAESHTYATTASGLHRLLKGALGADLKFKLFKWRFK